MSEKRLLAGVVALWAWSLSASAQEPQILDQRGVIERVQKHNPTVKAAVLQLQSSRQDVLRLEAQYTPVLVLDSSFTQTQSPSPYSPSRITTQRRGDGGAEIRKRFLWGTDLSLRVAGSAQYTRIPPGGAVGGVPVTGAPTTGSPVSLGALSDGIWPIFGVLAKLTLKQPLLRGSGRDVAEAELNAARVQRTSSDLARERVASEQLRDALIAYWELWYADQALHIEQRSRELAKRQRDEAEARVKTGSLAAVELLTFESQLAAREEEIVAAEGERKRAELELARLLGQNEQSVPMTIADDAAPVRSLAPLHSLHEQALQSSLELRERAAALALASVRARTAAEPNRHRLDLDSYVQAQGSTIRDQDMYLLLGGKPDPALQQFAQLNAVSGFVGLTYELPINSRAHHAAEAKARAGVQVAEQELLAIRQRVLSDTDKAHEQYAATERRLELARQTAEIAGRQREAEEARYKTGAGTSLQVLEAEERVRNAQLRVARGEADLVQTDLRLAHLTGGLLARSAAGR